MVSYLQNIMTRLLLVVVLFGLMAPSHAIAADGSVGQNSTASSSILVLIGKLIVVRSMADFNLGTYTPGSGDINANDDINVASNYNGITYQVTLNGSGVGGAFTLTDGTTTLPYLAYYNDATGTLGRVQATAGTPLTGRLNTVSDQTDTTLNANLSIFIDQSDLENVDSGTYTGAISVVVQPE